DGVGGAGPRAQLATDALLQPVLVPVQEVPADVGPGRHWPDLVRIALGDVAPEDLPERDGEPLGHPESALEDGPAGPGPIVRRGPLAHRLASVSPWAARGPPTNSGPISSSTTTVPAPVRRAASRSPRSGGRAMDAPVTRIHSRPSGISTFHPNA